MRCQKESSSGRDPRQDLSEANLLTAHFEALESLDMHYPRRLGRSAAEELGGSLGNASSPS